MNRIDGGIIAAYYAQALQSVPPKLSPPAANEYVVRLLETLEVQYREDGETYAGQLCDVLRAVEASGQEGLVIEKAVEKILVLVQQGTPV